MTSSDTVKVRKLIVLKMREGVLLLLVALAVRLLLLWLGSYEWLGQRIEISTPVGQWKRSRVNIIM